MDDKVRKLMRILACVSRSWGKKVRKRKRRDQIKKKIKNKRRRNKKKKN